MRFISGYRRIRKDIGGGNVNRLRVNITRQCNHNCSYCYMKQSNEEINLELLMNNVKDYHVKNISLSGGEPLLYKKFNLLMEQLIQEDMKVHIVTNGDYISEKEDILQIAVSHRLNLQFSLSIDEEGKCNSRAVRKLDELGIKTNIFLYPLTNENLIRNKDVLFHKGREIILLFPVSMGNNSGVHITPNEWIIIINKWKKYFENKSIVLKAQTAFKDVESYFNNETLKEFDYTDGKFLDCDGKLYDCCLVAEKSHIMQKEYCCDSKSCPLLEKYSESGYNTTCPFNLISIIP